MNPISNYIDFSGSFEIGREFTLSLLCDQYYPTNSSATHTKESTHLPKNLVTNHVDFLLIH